MLLGIAIALMGLLDEDSNDLHRVIRDWLLEKLGLILLNIRNAMWADYYSYYKDVLVFVSVLVTVFVVVLTTGSDAWTMIK